MRTSEVYQAPPPPRQPEPLAVAETVAARMVGISPRALWGLRKAGRGPRHYRVGNRVLYAVAALQEWIAEQSAASTTEVAE
jgi:predicted DNA-binding transcriptional regulator AlpA